MIKLLLRYSIVVGTLPFARFASADAVTPQYDTFGKLTAPGATFNGGTTPSGNPIEPVAISTFFDSSNGSTVTIGLAAQQRYTNPALTNDGAGTFFATPGANTPPGKSTGALWNFDYYIGVSGGTGKLSDYSFSLLYDFDPGANTDSSSLGVMNLSSFASLAGATANFSDSQNLDFGFLATNTSGYVTAPTGVTTFDPNALGEYSFELSVAKGGTTEAVSAINVDVQNPPPPASVPDTGSTMVLLGMSLTGLGAAARRFRA